MQIKYFADATILCLYIYNSKLIIHIYMYTHLACRFDSLDSINVETAEPTGDPKFCLDLKLPQAGFIRKYFLLLPEYIYLRRYFRQCKEIYGSPCL